MTKQYIRELLASTDIDDITLGVIIGAQKGILPKIAVKDKYFSLYKLEYRIHAFKLGEDRIVICNKEVYYICHNSFIGIVKDEKREGFIADRFSNNSSYSGYLWNDNSLPKLNEVLKQDSSS